MKSKAIYLLVATLLITNGVMLFMLIKKPHMEPMGRPEGFLVQRLGFNEEQEKQFFVLEKEHRNNMVALDTEIHEHKTKTFESLSQSNEIDDSNALKIGSLVEKREKEIFSFFTKVKAICNKEQLDKFDDILKRVFLNSGQGFRKGEGNGMHPPRDREEGRRPPQHPPRD